MAAGITAIAAAAAWPAAGVAVVVFGGYKLYTSPAVRGWTSDLVKKVQGK
jgi:hypothetical protein